MGRGNSRVRSTGRRDLGNCWIAIFLAVVTVVFAKPLVCGAKTRSFDDLSLATLDLSAYPHLHYLSAQGNRLQRLDVSGNPWLEHLLLFENRFDRRGIENLLSGLVSHGRSDGFLGLNGVSKPTLSSDGRTNLNTLRSRNWHVPSPGIERHFDLRARVFYWDCDPLGRGEEQAVWSYASSSVEANVQPLPESGFVTNEPRWFHATAPEGFYSVTSIDLSNKGLIGGLDLKSFPSLFQTKLFCNGLTSVDLSSNRWLATADLSDNQLVGIDFSGNPLLEELRISNNDLTELEPSENPRILFLDARYNRFSAEAVDTLLATLVAHGRTGGTVLLDGGGNAAPTARGRGAAWVLTRRFWRVTTNADLDYDADQLPDAWELEVFGDIRENGSGDADGDGLNNLRERLLYLDPTHADSDGDGYLDGVEVAAATDPLDPKDIPPPSGVIEGLVWHDADRNLKRDAIENGIGGIGVFLSSGKGSDRVTLRTSTSSEGIYRFADLTGGSYSVAIDWGHWKPLQTTVRKVILNGETEPIGIDFALIDPTVAFSQWASQEFGENIADPRGDPDGDGYPNLLEYALGTHPLVATVKGLPEIESYDDGEGFRLSLRYRMNRDAIDARLVTETYRDGRWQQVEETPGWTGSNRKNSIPVAEGEFGLLRLRASLANDPATTVSSPCWGGHALVLDPGIRSVGLPLVNKRLFAGRVLSNDATSVTLPKLDVPLVKLLGQRRSYLEVVEGLFEGERWEVAGVQPWSDRLALAVQHAANTWKGALPNLVGQKVVVRSHFTLGQVFGRANEQVLFASASSEEADRVWFLEAGRLAPYHFAATSDGKRTLGWSRWSDLSRFWDERPIFPGEGFFAERQGTHGISLFLLGEVRANRLAMPLSAGSNFVSSGVPFRQSFGGLRLTPLRGLNAGPFPQQADQAFLWTGREFEPYFLFGAFGRGSRWSRADDAKLIDRASSPLIGPDEGFFLDLIEPRRLYFPPSPSTLR